MEEAEKILDAFLAKYGSESNYLQSEGRVIHERGECEKIFKDYLEEHNLLEHAYLNFSSKIVAPTSVTYDNINPKIRVNI